ncbi:antitermination regulator [Intrasporangium oryzae NRRL B-24470]|uniref:Antitermination regulator n=1 Tax=Intrasporangium oryzae NRRL B-24470 TaxID=1386089 RepID=W9G9S7_9MICO|nr:GAF and ANTAR domain-containing protein [Intrasporangium oryzae]EWT00609.1 antitermination regulator [Intrasporangium oryzae NRRL B-24470]
MSNESRAPDRRTKRSTDLEANTLRVEELITRYRMVEPVTAAGPGAAPTMEDVARHAVKVIEGADSASITTLRAGRFSTPAATDDATREADYLQYRLGSGPCVDAVLDATVYHPADLLHDDRWPEFGRLVAEEFGFRSMLSFRLLTDLDDDSIAGLNVYARAPRAFDEHDVLTGLLLAAHAAGAVTAATSRERVVNLERALQSNRDIGTAMGIIMGLHKVTRERAFDLLHAASQNHNRKLRDVAADVIETGTLWIDPA